jgi:hypothetical protein
MSAVRIALPVAASDFSPPGLTIVQSYTKVDWLLEKRSDKAVSKGY